MTIVKPVRVGFSTLLTGALASYVANEPSPILLLLPTEADCRDYMVSDVESIFDATPALSGLLSAEADDTGRNTLLSRRFAGGSLKIVAAKAPRNLRWHNVRVLLMDEVDGMETTAEGSPLILAEKRTLSFANRKIILGSTPTIEETSNVLRSYRLSDQRIFEVPCPECGAFTEIQWGHIEWEPDKPETADLAFLATAYGKPFTAAGFGNRMREWCDKAGLSDCSTHGLRKAAASRLAELGCTEFEIMAITGHQTSKEVTRYTKAASQRLRAESALAKLTGTKS